jgi:hypothetical protein
LGKEKYMKKFGYAGNILKVDLSSNFITTLPSEDYTVSLLGTNLNY